jgi:hypothetical protein
MEKTAVEFLSETFGKHFGTGWLVDETIKKEIEQANEIFEKQIEEAFEKGFITTQWDKTKENKAEQYYNETFNK